MTFSTTPSPSISRSQIESFKVVVFQVAGHWLALPTSAVLKITRLSQREPEKVKGDGLTTWNNLPLVYLDLSSLLSSQQQIRLFPPLGSQLPGSHELVIIAQARASEPCAISVDKPPTVMELSLSEIQPLPPHYQHAIAGIADHIAVISDQGSTINILLLNLQQALNKSLQRLQRGV